VTRSQQAVNEAFMAALSDLNRTIVEVRSEEAAKRAGLLARLRHYERLLARAPEPETAPSPSEAGRPSASAADHAPAAEAHPSPASDADSARAAADSVNPRR
jgi:hypothetical protein